MALNLLIFIGLKKQSLYYFFAEMIAIKIGFSCGGSKLIEVFCSKISIGVVNFWFQSYAAVAFIEVIRLFDEVSFRNIC